MNNYVIGALIVLLIGIGAFYFITQSPMTSQFPAGLEAAVRQEVQEQKGNEWDKKLTLTAVDTSGTAAHGTWVANDAWGWLAWQEDAGWRVLISLDGFNCQDLIQMPEEHQAFFKEVTTAPSGVAYCYAW